MTKEQAKTLWPAIKAWSEGKTIQVRCKNDTDPWEDYRPGESNATPNFVNENWLWRIKPEPRHFWVGLPCTTAPVGAVYCDTKPSFPMTVDLIHCVEVLDDQFASEVKKSK